MVDGGDGVVCFGGGDGGVGLWLLVWVRTRGFEGGGVGRRRGNDKFWAIGVRVREVLR